MSNKEEGKVEVPEAVTKLAAEIRKEFKIGEGGVVEVSKDFYERHLSSGLTMADVKKVQEHNNLFLSATGLALGEVGIAHFQKAKKAEEVSVEFNAGKDPVALMFQRVKSVPDGSGGQKEKFGVLSAKWTVNGAGNRGSFKKVRDHLANTAAAVLAG